MSTTAIIANWQLPLGMLVVSILIGASTLAFMVRGLAFRTSAALRWIIAAATVVPTLIILIGLGFAMPMPQMVHTGAVTTFSYKLPRPPESGVGDALCMALMVVQIVALTFTGIIYARHALASAPLRAGGAGIGCAALIMLTLLAALGAGQALAGANL